MFREEHLRSLILDSGRFITISLEKLFFFKLVIKKI